MKWLEDPAHDLWLVPDGSSTQYFDLRTNDEKFTGYGVLTLKKEAQTGMRACYCLYFPVVLLLKAFHRICRFSDSHRQFGREFTNLLATFHLNHRTAHLPIMSLIVWFRACAQKLRLTSRTTTTPTEYCAKKHGKMPKNPACHAKAAILSRMAALFPLTKFQSICYHSSPRNFLKQSATARARCAFFRPCSLHAQMEFHKSIVARPSNVCTPPKAARISSRKATSPI